MWRLFPCIPIFRVGGWGGGGVGFGLKSVKKVRMCDYVKNRIVTCENVFFGLNEGISELVR